MTRPILVRGARQLLTLRGLSAPRRGAQLNDIGIIHDGAVLISYGKILAVGPSRRIENLLEARGAQEIDASGRVVLPGFVDSHTHLVSSPATLLSSEVSAAAASLDDLAPGGTNLDEIPARTLELNALRFIQSCVRQGTTTMEAKSGFGVTYKGELKILRAHEALKADPITLASTFMARQFVPSEEYQTPDEYIDWLCASMLPAIRKRRLADFVDITCEENFFNPRQVRRFLETARALGFGLKLHTGQYANTGGVPLAVELGATSADHVIYVSHEDRSILARSGTIATLLPGPVFYLGMQRYPDVRSLIESGVAVALATNFNPETSPSNSMQMMLSLACRKMGMTAAEAISAATINAAHALRLADQVGSIERNKEADLIVLSVPDYREIPYHFGVNLVETAIKRGRVIYHASEVLCAPR